MTNPKFRTQLCTHCAQN